MLRKRFNIARLTGCSNAPCGLHGEDIFLSLRLGLNRPSGSHQLSYPNKKILAVLAVAP